MSGQKIIHQEPRSGTAYSLIRDAAIAIYGGKCEWCGTADSALEFDHVYGGGEEHRSRERVNVVKRRIVKEGRRLVDVHLQLLCTPCHRSKSGLENGLRRLAERGIHLALPTRPVTHRQIRLDADLLIKGVLT